MTARQMGGFSIVEALVALVVLSVGMLGIAALYVESLRAGRTAIYRTQAVNLAADMADRIRANRLSGAQAAAYATATYGGNPIQQGCVGAPGPCTPAQLAQDDLARWLNAIRNPASPTALPGNANGTVIVNAGLVPTQYTIQVNWSEPGDANLSYTLTFQL